MHTERISKNTVALVLVARAVRSNCFNMECEVIESDEADLRLILINPNCSKDPHPCKGSMVMTQILGHTFLFKYSFP